MITITEALVAEHSAFCAVFEEMEAVLQKLSTVGEVKLLLGVLEGMLVGHSEAETELAYVALDHVLAEKGELERLHEDHREVDAHLRRAQAAEEFGEARRRLQEALEASRAHFRYEERAIFPLIERVLQQATLEELGKDWMRRYLEARRPAANAA